MERSIRKVKDDGCYDIIKELVDKAFERVELDLSPDTYITYVPMYKRKERRRGFNQAALIAQRVGEKTNRPTINLLEKIEDGRSQASLSPQERLENVKNKFGLKKGRVCPANVLLVDDFKVSGATIKECFNVLRQGGAKNVWGFTLAGAN
jgi:ComF family protein